MSKVLAIRTPWGIDAGDNLENWKTLFPAWKKQGFAGVELNVGRINDPVAVRSLCDEYGFEVIAQVHSGWINYIGPRPTGFSAETLLRAYREELEKAKLLKPFRINAHSGSDHLPLEESIKFYRGTLEIDAELGLEGKVSHETHRKRSLFNPYVTAAILDQVPKLRLTADISHWVVVCERLLNVGEEDKALLEKIIPHVQHIHTRMGTDQSSQIPEPTNPFFDKERQFFENVWKRMIEAFVAARPGEPITFVPEYGPYPYHPFGSKTDNNEVADSEGARLQVLFDSFIKGA
ncbi:hypothetical protein GQ53DRAFT_679349 [Thozetella sp. PMI_491]|nr:hypothetical protein GQ53DRAFT_679349 [Thozetella sp. PMI_491]